MKQFRAVGGFILSKETGRILTLLRSNTESYPGTWSLCGGRIESGETEHQALLREIEEELGSVEIKKTVPLHRYQSRNKDFVYDSFIVLVDKEFVPTLNQESQGFAWTDIDHIPCPLHPKTKKMMANNRLVDKFKSFDNWVHTDGSRDC